MEELVDRVKEGGRLSGRKVNRIQESPKETSKFRRDFYLARNVLARGRRVKVVQV